MPWLVSEVPIVLCGVLFSSANSRGFCTPLTVLVTRSDVCQQTGKSQPVVSMCWTYSSGFCRVCWLVCFSDHFTVCCTLSLEREKTVKLSPCASVYPQGYLRQVVPPLIEGPLEMTKPYLLIS